MRPRCRSPTATSKNTSGLSCGMTLWITGSWKVVHVSGHSDASPRDSSGPWLSTSAGTTPCIPAAAGCCWPILLGKETQRVGVFVRVGFTILLSLASLSSSSELRRHVFIRF
ncbi:hypothetical protein E2C01_001704 [Portunus trituberculatus]|uniref:Uncharacterized protein n=1 Tax=Portunus trituberculatus TaxID=210409 RepID=A0A5B7CJY4_PORTR|nr:hypothetical protein [Portunus trituberculatus]